MEVASFSLVHGIWAAIGLGAYALFFILFIVILGATIVYTIKFFKAQQFIAKFLQIIGIMMCIVVLAMSLLYPVFFEWTSLQIMDDGTWILKNAWGIKQASISKNTPRKIAYDNKLPNWYGGIDTSKTAARLYIVTDSKIYPSWVHTNQEEVRRLFGRLDEVIQVQQIPLPQNKKLPFEAYSVLRYVRSGFWIVLIVCSMPYIRLLKKEQSS